MIPEYLYEVEEPDWRKCPEDIVEELTRYIMQGVPLGDFLEAVVRDKLIESMGRADQRNRRALPHICAWIYNKMPLAARQYDSWLKLHAEAKRQAELNK